MALVTIDAKQPALRRIETDAVKQAIERLVHAVQIAHHKIPPHGVGR